MSGREFYTREGKIAYVRRNPAWGGNYTFYARPADRHDLAGQRIKTRGDLAMAFSDRQECEEALAAYAKKRGWKEKTS